MKERIFYPRGFSTENYASYLTPREIKKFSSLVHLAKEAKAYPSQSGYKVRSAALTVDGTVHSGGNKEYGWSDAFVHGETAAASGLRDKTESPIEAIAWYFESKDEKKPVSEEFARPCGNCRDILLEYAGPELVLLTGNQKGIVYTKLKDFLFENFRRTDSSKIGASFIDRALSAARAGNDVYLPDRMKPEMYGAALVAENGWIWPGSHYANVSYDPVTPVMNAINSWYSSYPKGTIDENRLRLSKLLVVGEKQIPHVFYRDRQAILENDEILRKFTKSSTPLKVEILQVGGEAYETNVEEWLPHPFSPGAFRMDDVMMAQLGKLIGVDNLSLIE